MKTWRLNSQQHINVDIHRNVYFKYVNQKPQQGIKLTWRHFLNLNDIIMDLETFHTMKFYPLGSNTWLQFYKNQIQFYHCVHSFYFTFDKISWKRYIDDIHRSILSFLRHEAKALQRRKYTSSHESLFQSRTRKTTSTASKQQILSRSTSNVGGENEQWKKSSDLSKWDSANPRRPFSFISAVHALRTTDDATKDMEEGEVCDIETDCGQFSDFCSIE